MVITPLYMLSNCIKHLLFTRDIIIVRVLARLDGKAPGGDSVALKWTYSPAALKFLRKRHKCILFFSPSYETSLAVTHPLIFFDMLCLCREQPS
ncbi:hypothetical protein AFLA_001624 [Aspergillus flavus NRRL3357]|nr:hypothetical protein AFLA_001624 [Aspergillus flavus NRRL3357]